MIHVDVDEQHAKMKSTCVFIFNELQPQIVANGVKSNWYTLLWVHVWFDTVTVYRSVVCARAEHVRRNVITSKFRAL